MKWLNKQISLLVILFGLRMAHSISKFSPKWFLQLNIIIYFYLYFSSYPRWAWIFELYGLNETCLEINFIPKEFSITNKVNEQKIDWFYPIPCRICWKITQVFDVIFSQKNDSKMSGLKWEIKCKSVNHQWEHKSTAIYASLILCSSGLYTHEYII